ncbi:MAG: BlaI/MecI/CopY family transcriptional regulator [Anaerolineaceae bacterium]|nr:BlaI/MecI/CopY family transcriptional regulator [Anaerolineaceae bacterium]
MPDNMYRKIKNKPGQGLQKFLGELELAVMEVIWEREPLNVADVLATLNKQKHNLAYTSVMTVMSRLVEKGWLKAEKRGRAFFYRTVYSRQEAEAAAVGDVVRALLRDFGDVAVAEFIKELDGISPHTLNRLAELGREIEKDNDEQA